MITSVQHLRGTSADWQAHDIVIPDGELALERTPNGRTVIKIGDGCSKYSELSSIFGQTVRTDDEYVELHHACRYICGTKYSINIKLPDDPDDSFHAEISFRTRNNIIDFSIEGGDVVFSGDGTADGIFIPEPKTYYTLFIWYEDTVFHGVVRGVPNA